MDTLPDEIITCVITKLYPTELINICMVSKHFSDLGTDDRLFRILCTVQFQQYATDWIFKLPQNWTWKELFIKLFNVKRQMISEMYARMGLTYEHSYREYGQGVRHSCYCDDNPNLNNMTSEERFNLNGDHMPLLATVKVDRFDLYGIVEPLTFHPDLKMSLNIKDVMYFRRKMLDIAGDFKEKFEKLNENGYMNVNSVVLEEGLCMWNKELKTYLSIFSMSGLRNIFLYYEDIIMKEYIEKSYAAYELLSEEFNVVYECPFISIKDFYTFRDQAENKLKEQGWIVIVSGYSHEGLSLIISRYPKSILFEGDECSKSDMNKYLNCKISLFNHLNEKLHVTKYLQYPKQMTLEQMGPEQVKSEDKSGVKPDIPKTLVLDCVGLDGNPVILKLIESSISRNMDRRVTHIKDNDDILENPYAYRGADIADDDNDTDE